MQLNLNFFSPFHPIQYNYLAERQHYNLALVQCAYVPGLFDTDLDLGPISNFLN